MAEIATKVCGVTVESFFKKVTLFKDAHCSEIAQRCLEAFASYALKPSQISVRRGDQTFNYDLSFSLFNGNGAFKVSAEKLGIVLQNATSDKDFEIVQDCIAKVYEHVTLPEIDRTTIVANAHASFTSHEAMQGYLSRYADTTRQIVLGGAIAYIIVGNWPEEIRLAIDKSVVYPNSIFLTWETIYRGNKMSRDVLKNIKTAFGESVTKLDLTFPKTN